ncbi:MAG: hypothetical protein OJF59_002193 [Cytophagales bacterium]|jgi:hypothetical protein|nr:hypothetical protein [Bacteroidota bacterium]MBS1981077.1 hypothetical protein [Bacteroidota bacterium]WHZ08439.1 MAG: hypothetical protein OJF59_002193 [Cytophagales bacterium]
MALLGFFGKKKKEFKAFCNVTHEPLEKGFGYLLTTAQVISSKKYWDLIMTEPETLSYTISHFNNQPGGTQMRHMIFEKYASVNKPWIVSDSVINYFEVDKIQARNSAQKWWESEGNYVPEASGPAVQQLDGSSFNDFKEYAVLEAGRVKASSRK